jgi:cell pole-organizing protein PopZ
MNRPDKAGEPSMEEILASIRQIIADEPSTDRPASAAEVAGGAGLASSPDRGPAGASLTDDNRPPLLDRLSGVLRSGSLPPTKPLGSKRPLSFDQDLADMFDEDEANAVAAPKPDIRVPPELSVSAQPKAAETSAASAAKPEVDGASALPPQLAPSKPFVPPLPFGGSDPQEKEPAAPLAPRSFGFPPLRKQGFIPQTTPVLPPLPPTDTKAELAVGASASAGTGPSAEDALKRLSGFGAVVPGEIAATPSSPQPSTGLFGAPALGSADAGSGSAGVRAPELSLNADRAPASDPVSSTPSPAPPLATPAPLRAGFIDSIADRPLPEVSPAVADVKPAEEPKLPPLSPAPLATDKIFDERPLPSFSGVTAPATATLPQASVSPSAELPRYAASADTAAVAAQALDALAQGLAASAAASAVSSAAAGSAIPLTPVVEPSAPVVHPAPLASANALQPAAPVNAAPPRTLEDAVADMLRPMLQQWVADNMPRIIEKALRVEMAKSMKPGSKPPGT